MKCHLIISSSLFSPVFGFGFSSLAKGPGTRKTLGDHGREQVSFLRYPRDLNSLPLFVTETLLKDTTVKKKVLLFFLQ